jgi:hypothetical protein
MKTSLLSSWKRDIGDLVMFMVAVDWFTLPDCIFGYVSYVVTVALNKSTSFLNGIEKQAFTV